jgi:glutamine amidotransferase
MGVTDYGQHYASICGRGSVVGVQFHPEKSQATGLQLLRNFAEQ